MLRYIGRTSEARSSGKVWRSHRFSRLAMVFVFASFGSSIASATTISLSAHAESKLDWPFVVSGSVQVEWKLDDSSSIATASNNRGLDEYKRDPQFGSHKLVDTNSDASGSGASSSAQTSSDLLSATSDSFRGGADPWKSQASAYGQRDISLTALSTGTLRLAFRYHSSIEVSTEGRRTQEAYASSNFDLALKVKGTNDWLIYKLMDLQTGENADLAKVIYDFDAPFSKSVSGIGYFDIPVAAGTQYSLSVESYTITDVQSVTVPEPGTELLTIAASAMLGLAGRYRRNKAQGFGERRETTCETFRLLRAHQAGIEWITDSR